jgi:hypothetical protein
MKNDKNLIYTNNINNDNFNENIIDMIYNGYGEGGKGDGLDGKGPSQHRLMQDPAIDGNGINGGGQAYINKYFSKLSYIKSARII